MVAVAMAFERDLRFDLKSALLSKISLDWGRRRCQCL
jgi:hypothetical protein